ncbi:DUF6893 family small protein [Rhodococcus sp. KRD197]|jgi:hypothetical protein
MNVLGYITTAALGIVVAAAVVVGAKSVPDIKRYLRMRRM